MDDLVALIVGVAAYPRLDGWTIADDRTAEDAIAVAKALRGRNVPKDKIKLLLSTQTQRDLVEDVPVGPVTMEVLEKFIAEELGVPPFDGHRFLLFWSGHGVDAEGRSEPLLVMPDSFTMRGSRRRFKCLGIDHFRTQLQGMDGFAQQLLCVNACRTPAEWSMTSNDDPPDLVPTSRNPRADKVRQARFFAADELKPVPVER